MAEYYSKDLVGTEPNSITDAFLAPVRIFGVLKTIFAMGDPHKYRYSAALGGMSIVTIIAGALRIGEGAFPCVLVSGILCLVLAVYWRIKYNPKDAVDSNLRNIPVDNKAISNILNDLGDDINERLGKVE